jgi:hypothetical protein
MLALPTCRQPKSFIVHSLHNVQRAALSVCLSDSTFHLENSWTNSVQILYESMKDTPLEIVVISDFMPHVKRTCWTNKHERWEASLNVAF